MGVPHGSHYTMFSGFLRNHQSHAYIFQIASLYLFTEFSILIGCTSSFFVYFDWYSLQRGTKSHLKSQLPSEMTLLKSQQKFQST